MTDDEFLDCLRAAERCMDRTRSHRDTLRSLDQATRGRVTDRRQREALIQILSYLDKGSAHKLDETIQLLQKYLQQRESRTSLRDHEKMIRYAENYGADQKTLHMLQAQSMHIDMVKAHEVMHDLMLKPLIQKVYATMNKTSIELFAEAEAAAVREAQAAAAAKKAEHVEYLKTLANATLHLLSAVSGGTLSDSGQRVLVKFRKELQPLALELGYRIVFTGDRSTAVMVQA